MVALSAMLQDDVSRHWRSCPNNSITFHGTQPQTSPSLVSIIKSTGAEAVSLYQEGMDWTFLLAWEWFQRIAIRFALFLAVLIMGPSFALILFDLLFYVLRTTYDSVPLGRRRKKTIDVAVGMDNEKLEQER